MAMPLHKNLCPGGHEIYSFRRAFHSHHYYALGLSKSCPRVKKISKEIMHFTIRLIWPRPSTRTPAPGVMKFMILVGPSLVTITIYSVCLNNSL